MRIHTSVASIRSARQESAARGQRWALVPTMGNLHEGHLALVARARTLASRVAVSIFVNRLQFGKAEDFDAYPRTFDDDVAKLRAAGVDDLFAPTEAELYPEPQDVLVDPGPLQHTLEGASRPGHFRGVATVVLKLFHAVGPQAAVFGKKDYQQLQVIRHMTRQLGLDVHIDALETVRAADGLALSSRNGYLSAEERARAPLLHACLSHMRERLQAGERDWRALQADATERLRHAGWEPDYMAIRTRDGLQEPSVDARNLSRADRPLVVLGAAKLGRTRLIDNLEV